MNMNVRPDNISSLDFVPSRQDRFHPYDRETVEFDSAILNDRPRMKKSLLGRIFNAKTQDFLIGAAVTGSLSTATRLGVLGAAGALGVSTLPAALAAAAATGVVMGAYRFGKEYRNDLRIERNGGLAAADLLSAKSAKRFARHLLASTALSTAGGGMSYALVHVYGDQIVEAARHFGITDKASAAYSFVADKASSAVKAVADYDIVDKTQSVAASAYGSVKDSDLAAKVQSLDIPGKASAMVSEIRNYDYAEKLSAGVSSVKNKLSSFFSGLKADEFKAPKQVSSTIGPKIQDRLPEYGAATSAPAPSETATPLKAEPAPLMTRQPAQAPMTIKPAPHDFDPPRFSPTAPSVEPQPAPQAVPPKPAPAPVITETAKVEAPVQQPRAATIAADKMATTPPALEKPVTSGKEAVSQLLSPKADQPQSFVPAQEFAGKIKDDFLPATPKAPEMTGSTAQKPFETAAKPPAIETVPVPAPRPEPTITDRVGSHFEGQKLSKRAAALVEHAVKGDDQAQKDLAVKLLRGKGGFAKDAGMALDLYKSAAAAGNVQAKVDLAYVKFHGLGGSAADRTGAIAEMRSLARQNGHAKELLNDWLGKKVEHVRHAARSVAGAAHKNAEAPAPSSKSALGKLGCVFKTSGDGTPFAAVCKGGKDVLTSFRVGDKITLPGLK